MRSTLNPSTIESCPRKRRNWWYPLRSGERPRSDQTDVPTQVTDHPALIEAKITLQN